MRRKFDSLNVDKSFTVWAMDTMEAALEKTISLTKQYPGIKYVGNKTGGVILEEKGKIIEVNVGKNLLTCNQDKGICRHVLFAVLHPDFEL